MKKRYLLVFGILFSFYAHGSFANPGSRRPKDIHILKDTLDIKHRLLMFKYKKFKSKSIGELLRAINMNYRSIVFVQMKPLYLGFVSVIYSDELRLDIYTSEYKYLKRLVNEDEQENLWKIEDLLREKVTKIRVRTRNGESLKEYPKKPILPII